MQLPVIRLTTAMVMLASGGSATPFIAPGGGEPTMDLKAFWANHPRMDTDQTKTPNSDTSNADTSEHYPDGPTYQCWSKDEKSTLRVTRPYDCPKTNPTMARGVGKTTCRKQENETIYYIHLVPAYDCPRGFTTMSFVPTPTRVHGISDTEANGANHVGSVL